MLPSAWLSALAAAGNPEVTSVTTQEVAVQTKVEWCGQFTSNSSCSAELGVVFL